MSANSHDKQPVWRISRSCMILAKDQTLFVDNLAKCLMRHACKREEYNGREGNRSPDNACPSSDTPLQALNLLANKGSKTEPAACVAIVIVL